MQIEELIYKLQQIAKEHPGITVSINSSSDGGSDLFEDAADIETIQVVGNYDGSEDEDYDDEDEDYNEAFVLLS